MEQKTTVTKNDNGSYTETTTTKISPSDGFVHEADINKASRTNYGEYHKGYEIHKAYSTNNPKVVIPALIGFMILLLVFPIGTYFLDFTSDKKLFYIFLVITIFFEIVLVREIIKIKKKNNNK